MVGTGLGINGEVTMANMIHKSVEAKRARRGRYVAAIKPIKEIFNCTAMQAAGHVQEVFRTNAQLAAKLSEEKELVKSLKDKISDLELEILNLKASKE
jgi:hypothetical protein